MLCLLLLSRCRYKSNYADLCIIPMFIFGPTKSTDLNKKHRDNVMATQTFDSQKVGIIFQTVVACASFLTDNEVIIEFISKKGGKKCIMITFSSLIS